MTMMISTPDRAYVRKAPGPVSPITTPEPTNKPAPITPPMAIILSWRWLRAFLSVGGAVVASVIRSMDKWLPIQSTTWLSLLYQQLLGRGRRTGTIRCHQPDAGPAIQDVVDGHRAFGCDRILEPRPGDDDTLGHPLRRSLTAGRRDHVRRL